ncbi:TrbI/VirB10 family protein [Pseudoduganella namucuonensis]|uniref:Conjugal transfer pilus assembly protein TraB n=1 Tax=Pseudoduganella namucuonensis TaxID=1035707 RepID=A0A1I7M469_9BURK|nr:TrbI/VirB10 family protein [Pseudoduganella namucuonensis]SFV16739.1 conjugal transfer pilus assembly protein TraB [Pseudoduganella namucuonensis]
MKLREKWERFTGRLSPRHKQYLTAAGIVSGGIGMLWLVLTLSGAEKPKVAQRPDRSKEKVVVKPEQEGVTPLRVDPLDQWVGTAGKTLAQYKVDKEAQERLNADHKASEQSLMQRLAELERKQQEQSLAALSAPMTPIAPPPGPAQPATRQPPVPAAAPVQPAMPGNDMQGFPPGTPFAPVPMASAAGAAPSPEPAPVLVRINLPNPAAPGKAGEAGDTPPERGDAEEGAMLDTYLPVGFIRGETLSGIAAPTGGQAQANPLPVLIRLLDNAVLPNHFRSEVKECFVIASGYGSISASRAYLRTVNLSCVRRDGRALEVKIDGNVLGEDGMLGLRGRLVTMQGQMLANALRAGIVSGIGQGFAQSGASFSTTPFGTLATSPEGMGDRMQRGIAGGVGRALDNLANYYIKLAEETFPVIEIGAKRQVDIVLTKGVRLPRLAKEAGDASRD